MHACLLDFDATLSQRLMELEAAKAQAPSAKPTAEARIKELEDELVLAKTEADQLRSELDSEADTHEDVVACFEDDLEAERTARQELQSLLDSERVLHEHALEDTLRELQALKDSQQAATQSSTEQEATLKALQDKLDAAAKSRQAAETQLQEAETRHKQDMEAMRQSLEQDLRAQLEADLTESLTESLRATLTDELRTTIRAELQAQAPVKQEREKAAPAPAPAPAPAVATPMSRFEEVRNKARMLQSTALSTRAHMAALPTVSEDEATEAVADVMATMEAAKQKKGVDETQLRGQTLRQSVRNGNLPNRRAHAASQFVDTEVSAVDTLSCRVLLGLLSHPIMHLIVA